MYDIYVKLVVPIAIAIYPLSAVIIFFVTGDFEKTCFFTTVGEVFLTLWFGAISFLYDVFKELRRQREKRRKADGDV